MFRRFSTNFALLSIFLDGVAVVLSLLLANQARPQLNALPFLTDIPNPQEIPWVIYLAFPIMWVAILMLFSVYDGRRNLYVTDELTSLFAGGTLATVALAGALYLSYREISRALFLIFTLLAFGLQVAWRLGVRAYFRLNAAHNRSLRRVLIVGAGALGRKIEAQITQNLQLGLHVIGFLDDSVTKQLKDDRIFGNLDHINRLISENQVDDVVIALPLRAHARLNELVAHLHKYPIKVWVIPDYFDLALHKARVEEFAGLPMLDLRAPALNDTQRMLKRAFDLALTLPSLIFALPVMGIIALLIRLDSPGPVLFRQQRVGENGRLFEMLKFRTMVADAEAQRHLVEKINENGDLIHKRPNDPRVTKVGRFLRRTSLDEVPQILNVIKGEMSLVGPRPELPYLVDLYQPWQRSRFAVPQGMTGWWQVNGRSDKPMHLNSEDDLYYVQNYSLWLDLQIILKTILVVLRGRGAF